MKRWIRDWWRGFSDADMASMLEKLASPHMREPGSMLSITHAELRAYRYYHEIIRELRA